MTASRSIVDNTTLDWSTMVPSPSWDVKRLSSSGPDIEPLQSRVYNVTGNSTIGHGRMACLRYPSLHCMRTDFDSDLCTPHHEGIKPTPATTHYLQNELRN